MRALAILLLRLYKIGISPWLPAACRFTPSCSEYAAAAIGAHGLWKGVVLSLKRISCCHPFSGGGYDPVPSDVEEAQWFIRSRSI